MTFEQDRIKALEAHVKALEAKIRSMSCGNAYEYKVIRAAEKHFQIDDALRKTRSKRYVTARAVIAQVLRKKGLSYPEIGGILGKDPSTIMTLSKYDVDARDVAAVKRLANV